MIKLVNTKVHLGENFWELKEEDETGECSHKLFSRCGNFAPFYTFFFLGGDQNMYYVIKETKAYATVRHCSFHIKHVSLSTSF